MRKADANGPIATDASPTEPPRKDRVTLWAPPFGKDDAKVIYETRNRITSALDLWARWVAWLDRYVRNPKKK